MKRAPLIIALAAGMLAQSAFAQSSTPTIGYYRFDVPAGQSAWVCGFVTKTDFQAQASSIAPGANLPDGTPTSVITQTGANWGSFPLHYVEILSAGATQGLILDVVSNTASTVRVRGTITGTPTYCIRKHATLATVFQDIGGLVPFQDSVTLYNSNNTLSSFYPAAAASWVAEDFFTPANDTIIYPGQGFVISASNATTLTFGGNEVAYVKNGPTQVPVYRGQTNLVGLINPLVATAPTDPIFNQISSTSQGGGVVTLASIGLTTSSLEEFIDSITLFIQGGNLNPSGSYYVGGGQVYADDFFTPAGSTVLRNGHAFVISAENADRIWRQTQQHPTP